jgi:hypothetical protein
MVIAIGIEVVIIYMGAAFIAGSVLTAADSATNESTSSLSTMTPLWQLVRVTTGTNYIFHINWYFYLTTG